MPNQPDLDFGAALTPAPTRNHRVPVYRVALVRDGSLKSSTPRLAADSPAAAVQLVRDFIGDSPQEHLVMVAIDARSRVIGVTEVSRGTLQASLVHPRESFRTAILLNAAAVIFSHNHPSGDCTPSPEDRDTTRRLVRAGEILGIAALDHVILGDPQVEKHYFSFRDGGLIS